MHRFRIEFADGGAVEETDPDMQTAISSAVLARYMITYKTGNKVCVEVVKAERMEE